MDNEITSVNTSAQSGRTTFLLAFFFGIFGAHRFYVRKKGTALWMLLSLGGLGIWLFSDLIFIISNRFEDKEGNRIVFMQNPSSFKKGLLGFVSVLGEILIYLGIFFFCIFYFTAGLIKPIQDQLTAIQQRNLPLAYTYTSRDFQHNVSYEAFQQAINSSSLLTNNASFSWTQRQFENDRGFVRGTITSKDGVILPIEYYLIKENGEWKIQGFDLNPKNTLEQSEAQSQPVSSVEGYLIHKDTIAKFSIHYPSTWDNRSKKTGQFYVRGKKGTESYDSFIMIHTIPTKETGGTFSTAKAYLNNFKKQIRRKFSNVKFLSEGEAELPQNPKEFQGEYIVFSFTHNNMTIKRMDFVIQRNDGLAFYDWSYTAPEKQFEINLPVAKTMYESWLIE